MVAKFLAATVALTGLTLISTPASADLAPGDAHSFHLAVFNGVIYYTVEQDGYQVVVTMACEADALPVRFVSTLAPGQRMVLSTPQSVGQPSIDLEIVRNGDALVVAEPLRSSKAVIIEDVPTSAALER